VASYTSLKQMVDAALCNVAHCFDTRREVRRLIDTAARCPVVVTNLRATTELEAQDLEQINASEDVRAGAVPAADPACPVLR
jgi:hypothetical protein